MFVTGDDREYYCLVDIEDHELRYREWKLCAQHGYVDDEHCRPIQNIILGTDAFVRHANHNVLDNRRQNLVRVPELDDLPAEFRYLVETLPKWTSYHHYGEIYQIKIHQDFPGHQKAKYISSKDRDQVPRLIYEAVDYLCSHAPSNCDWISGLSADQIQSYHSYFNELERFRPRPRHPLFTKRASLISHHHLRYVCVGLAFHPTTGALIGLDQSPRFRLPLLSLAMRVEIKNMENNGNQYEKERKLAIESREYLHPYDYYQSLIYVPDPTSVQALQPVLEFVTTDEQRDIYQFYRNRISSLREGQPPGRLVYCLVKDQSSGRYLGIISISDDTYQVSDRDRAIGWSQEIKKGKIKHLLNITTCVPVQPFGYNCCGGKLLASLCFSREMYDYLHQKYGYPIISLVTTSLHGKSIQYDRLPSLRQVGYTKGYGTIKVNDLMYRIVKQICAEARIQPGDSISRTFQTQMKLQKIRYALKLIGIHPNTLIKHGIYRGIYLGYFDHEWAKHLRVESPVPSLNSDKIQTVSSISDWWKKRWACRRYESLAATSRLSTDYQITLTQHEQSLERSKQHRLTKISKVGLDEYRQERNEYMRTYRAKNAKRVDKYTEEVVSDMKTLKQAGKSCREIAAILSDKYQTTINYKSVSRFTSS